MLKYEQSGVMCILNQDIINSNSHYFESRWYIGLGGNALVSPFYTSDLHVGINRCKLTGPGFLPYMDMAGTSSLSHSFQRGSLFDGGVHGIKELP